ncbi:MAG: SGNH/GDSL hydrolase family protein [Eubacteriales bacterium]|nr:SGNH/GDSL hydrolase family protein [Eubacteriales bacterium]
MNQALPQELLERYRFYAPGEAPLSLHGVSPDNPPGTLCRLPESLLPKLREPLRYLAYNTAGVRLRFTTNASSLCLAVQLRKPWFKTNMTPLAHSGFELYSGAEKSWRHEAVIRPKTSGEFLLDGERLLPSWQQEVSLSGEEKTYTLYLPHFMPLTALAVGLPHGCFLAPARPYALAKPLVFYGSSITQGACASRPSLGYAALVSQWLDADFANLGFAGHALGERALAEYIAGLPAISALILDYDHNAPTPEHLAQTHQAFLQTVRRARPTLPVLMLTRPSPLDQPEETSRRREIILRTYLQAVAEGDRHVAFLDGMALLTDEHPDGCLTDRVHPNDLGFYRMAKGVLPVLRELLLADGVSLPDR